MGKRLISARSAQGFYRCGRLWPKDGVRVSDEDFSEADWARLMGEINLTIADVPDEDAAPDPVILAIAMAIDALPDEAFTKAGPPKVSAVRKALGDEAVTVEQVAAAWELWKAAAEEEGEIDPDLAAELLNG